MKGDGDGRGNAARIPGTRLTAGGRRGPDRWSSRFRHRSGSRRSRATPPTGKLTRNELAVGRLDDAFKIQTSGPTDFHIQQVVLEPGADSGWHTHPGIALDIVKSGTVTAYLDDGECKPVKVEAGQAFLFPAGVTHIARNEGDDPAEIYVTYFVTAGADPRKDAEAPAGCKLNS